MDGPERDQSTRGEPGLLSDLATRRRFGGFAGLDLAAREFPETGKEARGGSPLDEPLSPLFENHDGRPQMRSPGPGGSNRQRPGVLELEMGPARERDRARRAVGMLRSADGFPELHDRLVELARTRRGQDGAEGILEAGPNGSVSHVPFLEGPAGRDPHAVRLEGDRGPVECDGRNGSSDVRPDAGQPLELGDGVGESTAFLAYDSSGGCVKVVGARVVARSFPEL